MTVGKSGHTPLKHWVLNAELGRQAGILSGAGTRLKCYAKATPFLILDLCAGDGVDNDDDGQCSPLIIMKHAKFCWDHDVDCKVVMIEKNNHTCTTLNENLKSRGLLRITEVLEMDASNYIMDITEKRQAVFINVDPNHVHDIPLTESLMGGMSQCTSMMVTLGCNVGGLGRLTREERLKWYGYVRLVLDSCPPWHDVLLIRLLRDSAKWAYLLKIPTTWSAGSQCRILKDAKRLWASGVEIASFRRQLAEFKRLEHVMFLTKKEYADEIA